MGLTVTTTHTLGVMVLGIVLTTSTRRRARTPVPVARPRQRPPARLRRRRPVAPGRAGPAAGPGRTPITNITITSTITITHDVHHDDTAGAHTHSHGGRAHSHAPIDPERPLHWRSLVAMGFAGGMVPAPSALVVLLGAIALGRTWFGVVLVVAYGLGMAATLTDRRSAARPRPGRCSTAGPQRPVAAVISGWPAWCAPCPSPPRR